MFETEQTAFRYTTPKLRLDHDSLTPDLLLSKTFHLICSPQRCIKLVTEIKKRRDGLTDAGSVSEPLFIWEPVPDLCTQDELSNCFEALKNIHIVSPNHAELASFFGKTAVKDGAIDRETIRECSDRWLQSGIGSQCGGAIVVRLGKEGCYVASRRRARWMPSYYQSQENVVDPTGGGNAFLGGLAISLSRSKSFPSLEGIEYAAACGSVAASFVIEQIGMPKLAKAMSSEMWNGELVQTRLATYLHKLNECVQT